MSKSIVAAADSDIGAMARTIAGFRGFTACLSAARERGVICGVGAWEAGAIDGMPAMRSAYTIGASA